MEANEEEGINRRKKRFDIKSTARITNMTDTAGGRRERKDITRETSFKLDGKSGTPRASSCVWLFVHLA